MAGHVPRKMAGEGGGGHSHNVSIHKEIVLCAQLGPLSILAVPPVCPHRGSGGCRQNTGLMLDFGRSMGLRVSLPQTLRMGSISEV